MRTCPVSPCLSYSGSWSVGQVLRAGVSQAPRPDAVLPRAPKAFEGAGTSAFPQFPGFLDFLLLWDTVGNDTPLTYAEYRRKEITLVSD